MRRLMLALLLACPALLPAQVVMDTSVTIQVRTRRASTGRTTITTTIVATPTAGRVDTVRLWSAALPDTMRVVHVDNHLFTYGTIGPTGQAVYLETGTQPLGLVRQILNTSTWEAWQYIKTVVNAQGYPVVTPPLLLGTYPSSDAAARALYAKCCPAKP